MAQVLTPTKASDAPLYLGRFREEIYFLLKPITWKPNPDQAPQLTPVEAPIGFVTDLASIPPILYSLLRPDGVYAYAAILHDYLYWIQDRPREQADEILRLSMIDFEVEASKVVAIYEAVRTFGRSAWAHNARLRASGEKREIVKFPPNARTSWIQWKKDPQVFAQRLPSP
ncbi:DUF1353 domain-containing protein [Bradyrhizobium yuanmingense]